MCMLCELDLVAYVMAMQDFALLKRDNGDKIQFPKQKWHKSRFEDVTLSIPGNSRLTCEDKA